MRGLHGTLAVDSGITSHAVAAALGHESFRTTAESHAQHDAVTSAQQKKVLGVLREGSSPPEPVRRLGPIVPQSFPRRPFQPKLKKNRSLFVEMNGIEPSAS